MSKIIGDTDTLQRLKNHQRSYILTLFDGQYDEEYVHSRLRIGLVHKQLRFTHLVAHLSSPGILIPDRSSCTMNCADTQKQTPARIFRQVIVPQCGSCIITVLNSCY